MSEYYLFCADCGLRSYLSQHRFRFGRPLCVECNRAARLAESSETQDGYAWAWDSSE